MAEYKQPYKIKYGLTLDGGNVRHISTGYHLLPKGSTAQRPLLLESGMLRYNTDTHRAEIVHNGNMYYMLNETDLRVAEDDALWQILTMGRNG